MASTNQSATQIASAPLLIDPCSIRTRCAWDDGLLQQI
jgi:hypothetical protein